MDGVAEAPRRGGAGILGYCVEPDGRVLFLLQQTFSGRKAGHLVDLGGAVDPGEAPWEAAQREFWEEGGKHLVSREALRDLFVASQTWEGVTFERRERGWTLFLVRFPHWDLGPLNSVPPPEGSKRREFFWVDSAALLAAVDRRVAAEPPREGVPPRVVWKRLRKKGLKKAVRTVLARVAALRDI